MLEDAKNDILRSYVAEARRRREAERLGELVRTIDKLLFELEDLNLRSVDRVPTPLRLKSTEILGRLPEPDRERLQVRYRVLPLMDVLFRAQELIFRRQYPDREIDEDEEAS
jgi:hypothetical protein